MSQMIINIGMVLALLPVIGIPLPLVSYGGSALVPSLVALGLLVGFARAEPEAAAALRDRRGERRTGKKRPAGIVAARAHLGRECPCPSPDRSTGRLRAVEARLMAPRPAAGPAGRRWDGRPHLAAARHRRRAAPPRPRHRDHRARHRARPGDPGRARRPATRSS